MIPAVRSELRKFFTTRLWWGMAIAVFAAAAGFAVLLGFVIDQGGRAAPGAGQLTGSDTQIANTVYTAGISVGYLLLLTIGILTIGAEFRHKTITATLLTTPSRVRAMLAKVVALVGIGVFYGLVSLVGSVSAGTVVLRLIDRPAFPSSDVVRTLALSLLVLALWALMGLGLGILIPNQVAALFIGVAVAWIVEPLLGLLRHVWAFSREHIAPFLPTSATNSLLDTVSQSPDEVRLQWWQGGLTLGAYALVLSVVGTWLLSRRDVA